MAVGLGTVRVLHQGGVFPPSSHSTRRLMTLGPHVVHDAFSIFGVYDTNQALFCLEHKELGGASRILQTPPALPLQFHPPLISAFLLTLLLTQCCDLLPLQKFYLRVLGGNRPSRRCWPDQEVPVRQWSLQNHPFG